MTSIDAPQETLTDWPALYGDALRGRRALVTGGAGFIGSHIAAALDRLGCEVVVLDDLSGGCAANLRQAPAACLVCGSILDANLLASSIQGCDLVFHQAALGSVPGSIHEPVRYHEVNVSGTVAVLEAARRAGVRRVMFAASSAAYGDSEVLPKIETMAALPKSPYAATKVACEAIMRAYAESYATDAVSLRYFNIFGPRQNANSAYAAVIAAFAKALLAGKRPHIYGDGTQSRDFTHVDNVVHANLLAATHAGKFGGDVINIACGERITVNELAEQAAAALGCPHLHPIHAAERQGDVKHSVADLQHANHTLGYRPVVRFSDGVRQTLGWYHAQNCQCAASVSTSAGLSSTR